MIVLALDTCLTACSAAVLTDGRPLASRSEAMARGHQERLATLVRELIDEAGLSFAALDRIGVTVGPGSFTGLRVGLAFAKGLALALDRPCIGVGTLEALAASVEQPAFRAAAIDAGRGHVYLQVFEAGRPLMAPDSLPIPAAAARLAELYPGGPAVLVGPGAPLLADVISAAALSPLTAPDPRAIARLAVQTPATPPRPMYLRAPDAKPKAA
jgi:tRNA threonylcarbamoyladenosine biosynthesis protein TsaB